MKKPTEEQIQKKRDEAQRATFRPEKFFSMTYSEGIRDALEWVLGDRDEDLEV